MKVDFDMQLTLMASSPYRMMAHRIGREFSLRRTPATARVGALPRALPPAAILASDSWLLASIRIGDASVENVGIKVRSVRPSYGAQLRIDADLREVGGIMQRLEDSAEAEMGREIDHALNAIFEPKMQAMIAERFCGHNVLQHDVVFHS
jgi:hypothetical protein